MLLFNEAHNLFLQGTTCLFEQRAISASTDQMAVTPITPTVLITLY